MPVNIKAGAPCGVASASRLVGVCRYLKDVRFLVVDANDFSRKMLRTVLRSYGALHVALAGDSDEAFGQLRFFHPDIVLLEWLLEPLDGAAFAKRVRTAEDSPDRHVPMIMVTAYTDLRRVAAARDAGINEIVARPFSALTVVRHLQEVIERPRPFVETATYFGPDRRRRAGGYQGPERRGAGPADPSAPLSQDEIDRVVAGEPLASA